MANKSDNTWKVKAEKVPLETDQGILQSEQRKWGLPLKDVYKHGLSFYKDKEGKAMHLSYEDRLKLVAYTQQAAHGPLDPSNASPLGVLDVIGKDRRAAWQALGEITQIQAMAGFVRTLDRLCPLFKPFLEAIQKDQENKEQQKLRKKEEEKAHIDFQNRLKLENQKQNNKVTEEQQVKRIKDALNAQTYNQFLQYAEQQFPANYDQQAVLIRQLQDQHYQQYIQQLAVDERLSNSNVREEDSSEETTKPEPAAECYYDNELPSGVGNKCLQTTEKTDLDDDNEESRDEEESGDGDVDEDDDGDGDGEIDDVFPPVEEARMWTRAAPAEVEAFKRSAADGGGRLAVAHGETLTVRVPTLDKAKALCWEFATDHFDIGFGMYFEWSKSPTTEVTVHVSESSDEYNDDDDFDETGISDEIDPESGEDPERGGGLSAGRRPPRPPLSLIVPVYRRDCHTEVYAGSHTYPGEGVYVLKFDNTYSLWRSKTLYYKVYYTQ